ncbi:PfkB family carbohydrate kinase [Streptomyces aquilus]|uniref:Sugar kinase n=1 Tax=Streptomyces aquilus TaxID=2548456 RepID=A0A3Q9BW56_9ACTN|nr:PfkB family carbohydrate kinase [Streptomyces aquilus]AZP15327.1 sugar kinase [Streptomyces aquilus]
MSQRPEGLFVGLCTFDVVQLVDHLPGPDEKVTARRQTVAAGGPAANAAAAFAHLGGAATLLTSIGSHPLGVAAAADLEGLGVTVRDLSADSTEPPSVSSILVTASSGDRAVASTNAVGRRIALPADLTALVAGYDVVEFDGHHMDLALAVARAARDAGCRTVLDGGSWKAGTEQLLPSIDVAVCADSFRPPGTTGPEEVLRFLRDHHVPWRAVSRGGRPLVWEGPHGGGTVDVPAVRVVDTLGAGDVLHGTLAHRLSLQTELTEPAFAGALRAATEWASRACTSFGTRDWMK